MRDSESNHVRILKKLESAFGRHYRRNDGKRSYPAKLKELALEAVDSGIAGRTVAEATGVTPKSLRNWRAGALTPPKELKIVTTHEALKPVVPAHACMAAKVTLPSGITIEIPISALTATLIEALNGGAV